MSFLYFLSKLLKKIRIPAIKNSCISKKSKVCSGSHIVNSKVDDFTYIGNDCVILNVELGKFCSIADNVIIGGASHPITWGSSSPVFHQGKNILKTNFSEHAFETSKKVKINNDVWIGNNALIKSGLTIHDGAIIGMGAVVTKDVGPYEIWGGNPAKLIKKRFSENKIKNLINSNWWNLNEKMIKEKAKDINDIEKFIEKLGEY